MKQYPIFFLLMLICFSSYAQDSLRTTIPKKRTGLLFAGGTLAYAGTLAGLSAVWYNKDRAKFHWFDDSGEWLLMDKAAHFTAAYHFSRLSCQLFKRLTISRNSQTLYSSLTGFLMISSVEVLDGFQNGYGASAYDLSANLLGAGLFAGQELLWHEQRIKPKFSYHTTAFPRHRPETLGKGFLEQVIKDYNGQTYWLSVDIHAFFSKKNTFPKWLNIAAGYGAEGMLYGFPNDPRHIKPPRRQFYLALDWDLSYIRTRSSLLKGLLFVLDAVKIPSPAVSMDSKGIFRFHPLYF